MNDIVPTTAMAPIEVPIRADGRFAPTNLSGLYELSRLISASALAPKGLETPESICVVMAKGLEIGLSPLTALQNIALINGRPGIFGDAALALVRSSKLCEYVFEKECGEHGTDSFGFACCVKRVGDPEEITRTFRVGDAKQAKLWGKSGPWTFYPSRMLQMRARGFALRDVFPDILSGIKTVEELQDYPEDEPRSVPSRVVEPSTIPADVPPPPANDDVQVF